MGRFLDQDLLWKCALPKAVIPRVLRNCLQQLDQPLFPISASPSILILSFSFPLGKLSNCIGDPGLPRGFHKGKTSDYIWEFNCCCC